MKFCQNVDFSDKLREVKIAVKLADFIAFKQHLIINVPIREIKSQFFLLPNRNDALTIFVQNYSLNRYKQLIRVSSFFAAIRKFSLFSRNHEGELQTGANLIMKKIFHNCT
jgi:autonomous glycyl radical cofactor GrcA